MNTMRSVKLHAIWDNEFTRIVRSKYYKKCIATLIYNDIYDTFLEWRNGR